MPAYPFLSDEWIAEARKIRAEFAADPDHQAPAAAASVRMNQVITEVPFGGGRLDAHLDTSSGTLEMETGHLDDPDVTVTLDYATAKAIFVDGTMEAGMKAFMDGKVRVQGDMAKLIAALQQLAPPEPGAVDQAQARIRDITE
ncbi:MAG TPA: SCP2 sterol-binding domain-containing protein [Acidimicrobiales bacterium]|nr:SCP2 sterol-binding domain-containing protein [Acidimicrobiales bacterium]